MIEGLLLGLLPGYQVTCKALGYPLPPFVLMGLVCWPNSLTNAACGRAPDKIIMRGKDSYWGLLLTYDCLAHPHFLTQDQPLNPINII